MSSSPCCTLRRRALSERRARAIAALTRVGLGDRVHHRPNQLSGGQQQRVAIARAMVMNPRVILADEPTGNLDSRTSEEVMALFQELSRSGITIMLVTHEPDIAEYAARRIVMKDGQPLSDVQQHTPPRRGRGATRRCRGWPISRSISRRSATVNLTHTLQIALQALLRNKMRSFLTMLGIIIGVFSVIAMVAVGDGAQARVHDLFASIGTNMLVVMPGAINQAGGVPSADSARSPLSPGTT